MRGPEFQYCYLHDGGVWTSHLLVQYVCFLGCQMGVEIWLQYPEEIVGGGGVKGEKGCDKAMGNPVLCKDEDLLLNCKPMRTATFTCRRYTLSP